MNDDENFMNDDENFMNDDEKLIRIRIFWEMTIN